MLFIPVAEQVLSKAKHQHEGKELKLRIFRETLGIIPGDHDCSRPHLLLPADTYISDLDLYKIQFLKTIPNTVKNWDARIDWEHDVETELHVWCTLRKDDKEAARDWEENLRKSIEFLFQSVEVKKRRCLAETWKDVYAEVQKFKRSNRTTAVIERAGESSIYIVGRAEAVDNVYDQIDEMCREIEERFQHIKETVKLTDLEKTILDKAKLTDSWKKMHVKMKITFQENRMALEGPDIEIIYQRVSEGQMREITMALEGPATDVLEMKEKVNLFLEDTEWRDLRLSEGQMRVITMLLKQPNSFLQNSFDELRITYNLEYRNISLFGMKEDVKIFEEIVEDNIKETSLPVSKEEQSALRDSIWEEFYNVTFIKYCGVLFLEQQENKSLVNLVAKANDFDSLLDDVQKHIRKYAVSELSLPMDNAQAKKVLQWMRFEERYPKVKVTFKEQEMTMEVPPKDAAEIELELNKFLDSTEERIKEFSRGQMRVFSMLYQQPSSAFANALEKLQVTFYIVENNIFLFGVKDDLDKFEQIFKNFIKETTIRVSKEEMTALRENVWDDFHNRLFTRHSGLLYLTLPKDHPLVQITAPAEAIEEIVDEINKHIQKNSTIEVQVNLEVAEIKMVVEWMKLEEKYPMVKCTTKGKFIILEGPPSISLQIRKELENFISRTRKRSVKLSEGYMTVFTMLQQRPNSSLHNFLKTLNITVQTEHDSLLTFGVAQDLDRFNAMLKDSIRKTAFAVSKEGQAGFREDLWQEFYNRMFTKHGGIIHLALLENKTYLNIVSQSESHEEILREVIQHIEKNAIRTVQLGIDTGKIEQISQWMKLEEKYSNLKFKISEKDLLLTGPPKSSLEAEHEIQGFRRNTEERKFPLSKGRLSVFTSLQKRPRSSFSASLKKLKVVSQIQDCEILLYGALEDLNKFEATVSQEIKETIINVTKEEQAALRDIVWEEFQNRLFTKYAGTYYIELLENGSSVYLASHVGLFRKVQDDITFHIQKNAVREVALRLKNAQIEKMLQWLKIDEMYPKLKITLNHNTILFTGPPDDSLNAEEQINCFLQNTRTTKLTLSKGKMNVFIMLQRQPESSFDHLFQNLKVMIQTEDGDTKLFGTVEDLKKFENIVRGNIQETTFLVSKVEQTSFKEDVWREFYTNLYIRYSGRLYMELLKSKSSVNLVAHTEDFEEILQEVKKHIQRNAVKDEIWKFDNAYARMISQWMKEDLVKIEQDLERFYVKIHPKGNLGFLISSAGDGLELSKIRIEHLANRIFMDEMTVASPLMPYYFTQESGRYFIKSLEDKYRVVIEYRGQTGWNGNELKQVTHPSGVVVRVIVGDMTLHPVDAIVNAANGNLDHVGGLAKAIVDKGINISHFFGTKTAN